MLAQQAAASRAELTKLKQAQQAAAAAKKKALPGAVGRKAPLASRITHPSASLAPRVV